MKITPLQLNDPMRGIPAGRYIQLQREAFERDLSTDSATLNTWLPTIRFMMNLLGAAAVRAFDKSTPAKQYIEQCQKTSGEFKLSPPYKVEAIEKAFTLLNSICIPQDLIFGLACNLPIVVDCAPLPGVIKLDTDTFAVPMMGTPENLRYLDGLSSELGHPRTPSAQDRLIKLENMMEHQTRLIQSLSAQVQSLVAALSARQADQVSPD